MATMFNSERLILARQRRSMTKRDLAAALNVNENTVRRHETGETVPASAMLERIARVLKFPEAFFFGGRLDAPQMEAASFRSMSDLPARDRVAALAAGALAFSVDEWIRKRFSLPPAVLINLSGEKPEAAARSLRQAWGIGERPIRNMVHLLEAKGVRVFSLAENTRAVDAFSVWHNNVPYVFLNTIKTAERSRMDAAHEVAHLTLHKHGGPDGREAEFEAQRFAGSFLMPSADVLAVLPHVYGINDLVKYKARWGVSTSALNYRLHKLGVTTDYQYRDLCIEISKRGYREKEPEGTGMAREMSAVWPQVLDALRKEGMTKYSIADALSLPSDELEKLLFMLAPMLSLDGGKVSAAQRSRANLKLVS